MGAKLVSVTVLLERAIEAADGSVITQIHSYPIKPETFCFTIGKLGANDPTMIEITGEAILKED